MLSLQSERQKFLSLQLSTGYFGVFPQSHGVETSHFRIKLICINNSNFPGPAAAIAGRVGVFFRIAGWRFPYVCRHQMNIVFQLTSAQTPVILIEIKLKTNNSTRKRIMKKRSVFTLGISILFIACLFVSTPSA